VLWVRWLGTALCAVQGAYMTFDGLRAFVVGSYLTPRSGPHAGELGPWAALVRKVGIQPESTGMKATFVLLGAGYLVAAVAWALGAGWGPWLGVVLAVGTLWYLIPGTVISVLVLLLVLVVPSAG
jgi:hypothetical protein